MLVDGWVARKGSHGGIGLQAKEEHDIFTTKFKKSLEKIGLNCRWDNCPSVTVKGEVKVISNSLKFYEWYEELGDEQRAIVEQYPREALAGFYESDGWAQPDSLGFTNTNPKLPRFMQRLLTSLGFDTSIINRGITAKGKRTHALTILGGIEYRNRFLDEIDLCIKNKKYKKRPCRRRSAKYSDEELLKL